MKTLFFYLIIFFGIALICFSILLFLNETNSAKEHCRLLNQTYSFKWLHLCNGEPIYQYEIGGKRMWLFQKDIPRLDNLTLNWSSLN